MKGLHIPRRFVDARVPLLLPAQYQTVIDYAAQIIPNVRAGRGIVIMGGIGVGKSYALAALTRAYFVETHGGHEFISASEMFGLFGIDDAWDDYREQPYSVTLMTVPWLVVDDLGREYRGGKLAEQVLNKFDRIVRARYDRFRPTFITTNLQKEEIGKMYGEAVTSRLVESAKVIQVRGVDRRRVAT